MPEPKLLTKLTELVGADHVSTARPDMIAYAADMWPRAQIWKTGGDIAQHTPEAVVSVGDRDELQAVLRLCAAAGKTVVPYGGGSGVCGGAMPVQGGVVVDVKRMNRLLSLDRESRLATVEAGALGIHVEQALNESGFTLGHFPSSVYCSTVGGYVAALSAGQFSTRYGTFRDMVVRLTVALPDGRLVRTGPWDGGTFDLTPVFTGAEGTLGFVVDATLRIRTAPETRVFRGFSFGSVDEGLEAMRDIMQAGLEPCVLRLYDPFDTLIAASEPHEAEAEVEASGRLARLLQGRLAPLVQPVWEDLQRNALQALLWRPATLNRLADRVPVRALLVAGFEGAQRSTTSAAEEAWRRLAAAGGRDRGPGPGEAWYQNRYAISFKQPKVFLAGAFVDTMEVSTTWDRLPTLYRRVRAAVGRHAFIMGHFSHAYREGCSVYFTFVGPCGDAADAARRHERIWQTGLDAVVAAGGSISHHHGIGLAKRHYLPAEHGAGGARVFQRLKSALDPDGRMNPGKLWEAPSEAAPAATERRETHLNPVDERSGVVDVGGAVTLAALEDHLAVQGFVAPCWTDGSGTATLAATLADTSRLDWGPRLGAPRDNLLAVRGRTHDGSRIEERPAARRAAGPSLASLLIGTDAFGVVEGATMRVARLPSVSTRIDWVHEDPLALLAAFRSMLDHDVVPARVGLWWRPGAPARMALLLWKESGLFPTEVAEATGRVPEGGTIERPSYDEPWPLPDRGFEASAWEAWGALRRRVRRERKRGEAFQIGRFSRHGGWLVSTTADRRQRTRGAGTNEILRALDDAFTVGG